MDIESKDSTKSKTQLKREFLDTQTFIKKLIDSPNSILRKVELDETLRTSIIAARQLKKSALKREIKFLSKCLREYDIDTIEQSYNQLQSPHTEDTAYFHKLEKWREQLLSDDHNTMTLTLEVLVTEHKGDRTTLRQMIRQAHREIEQDRPGKAARSLFRYLKDISR